MAKGTIQNTSVPMTLASGLCASGLVGAECPPFPRHPARACTARPRSGPNAFKALRKEEFLRAAICIAKVVGRKPLNAAWSCFPEPLGAES